MRNIVKNTAESTYPYFHICDQFHTNYLGDRKYTELFMKKRRTKQKEHSKL